MSKTNTILTVLALLLIVIGVTKPDLTIFVPQPNNDTNNILVVEKPTDEVLLEKANAVAKSLTDSSSTSKQQDAMRLASLYGDMATLISIDQEEEVIKTTEEVRQANSLSGLMLKLDIKGKYPDLSGAAQSLVISQIGDDIVPLDKSLREKAVGAFKALSWACKEGAK